MAAVFSQQLLQQLEASVALPFADPTVVLALRSLERYFTSAFAPAIHERLRGDRSRTLLHGDLHVGNCVRREGGGRGGGGGGGGGGRDGGHNGRLSKGRQQQRRKESVLFVDFQMAGTGHPVYELLYFLMFYEREVVMAPGTLNGILHAYHTALQQSTGGVGAAGLDAEGAAAGAAAGVAAHGRPGIDYSMQELQEDFALACVDMAAPRLVAATNGSLLPTMAIPTENDSAREESRAVLIARHNQRLLLYLKLAYQSDTWVGVKLRSMNPEPLLRATSNPAPL
jgi:hypothetical protein